MSKITKKRSQKAGLPPGTLVHIGEKKTEKLKITIMDYNETQLEEKEAQTVEECLPFKERPTVTWINIDGVHDLKIIEKIGQLFKLHALTLEDIVNTEQRPKMEDFPEYIFIVMKMLYWDKAAHRIETEQVSLVLGSNLVISFQEEKERDVFNPIRERIRKSNMKIRKMGADYLAYSLIDAVVDSYFLILEHIGEWIEEIEEVLVSAPRTETMHAIHGLKKEMILLRKSVWPLREVVNSLERGESPLIKESTGIFLRDVYDHTIQAMDTIEIFRDMTSGMLDLYLSSISNKMNEVMKVLTVIATLFIPTTFIVGVYGMNFEYMPELKWRYGYLLTWMVIIGVTSAMLFYFKKKKWY